MEAYKTTSAVLFLIFNRPEPSQRVFDAIKTAQPKRLYIAADGPRPNVAGDKLLCDQTRNIASEVNWECEIKTLFRENNAGCKAGVSAAINWFFEYEEEGVILEDDCLPANDFFKFCDTLLEKYREDDRVRHITGCNLQLGKKWGTASYYFSNRTHVWGWASWKRVWNTYDLHLTRYDEADVKAQMTNIYNDDLVAEAWAAVFRDVKANKINSWAYPLDFANFFNNGLVIIPNENLITNIGFSGNATNTLSEDSVYANIPSAELGEISHPVFMVPQKEADLSIINRDFGILEQRRKQNSLRRKIKARFKSIFFSK